LVIGKSHLAQTKKNPYKGSHKNPKSQNVGTSNQTSKDAPADTSKKKLWKPCKNCGKNNQLEKNVLRGRMNWKVPKTKTPRTSK